MPWIAGNWIPPDGEQGLPQDPIQQLETVIEDERTRLLKADSILGCVQIALDTEASDVDVPVVYFPYVVGTARELIAESLRRLDFLSLHPLVHQVARAGVDGHGN